MEVSVTPSLDVAGEMEEFVAGFGLEGVFEGSLSG